VNWFTKPLAEPATPASASDELKAVEAAYAQAEKEFSKACYDALQYQQVNREAGVLMLINGKAYNRVNGAALNPQLQLLCHVRELARMKRNSLLARRAAALKAVGKVR